MFSLSLKMPQMGFYAFGSISLYEMMKYYIIKGWFPKSQFPDVAPKEYQRASAHLVRPSPWPVLTALSLGSFLLSSAAYFHSFIFSFYYLLISLFVLVVSMFSWFSDVMFEASYEGQHTKLVQKALRFGMFLFMVSEMMFFISFFWAFFHFSLSPSVFLFCVWPPKGIDVIDTWGIPFLNTVILLSSGVTLTVSHSAILVKKYKMAWNGLFMTVIYGFIFTVCQLYEYVHCSFSMNDSVYGSIFFMATGFHGLHVIVGTIFLVVCLVRLKFGHFSNKSHLGFECAAYYWHFVDVVWLFLFITVYWWGS